MGRFVPAEDRALVATVHLPLVEVAPGDVDVRELLEDKQAFAAFLVDGMLLQSMRLQEQAGLRLLGPGHMVAFDNNPPSMLVVDSHVQATVPTRLALLGREFLVVTRRWPWLVAGLSARAAEQSQQLLTQLMICQLPRVNDRLLAMMWLLAESWGRVTASGTLLPLQLTHSALGGLVGARRPTVTLALRALTESGALLRQPDGWLLLRPPEAREPEAAANGKGARPLERILPGWGVSTVPRFEDEAPPARKDAVEVELQRTVERLAAEHTDFTA